MFQSKSQLCAKVSLKYMHFILKGVNSEVKLNSNISWNPQLPVTLLILKVSLYRNYKYTRTARPESEPGA